MTRTMCAVLAVLACACSAARPLQPLARQQIVLDVSAPMLVTNRPGDRLTPLPALMAGARYGVLDRLEVRAHVHPIPLIRRVVMLDAGVVWHPVRTEGGWGPNLHLTGDAILLTDPSFWDEGLAPSTRVGFIGGAITHVEPASWAWPYVACEALVAPGAGRASPSCAAGAQFRPGRKWVVSTEVGVAMFTDRTLDFTQAYIAVGDYGALRLGLGLSYRFGETKPAAPEAP